MFYEEQLATSTGVTATSTFSLIGTGSTFVAAIVKISEKTIQLYFGVAHQLTMTMNFISSDYKQNTRTSLDKCLYTLTKNVYI